jgi:hypothetical protein
MNKNYSLQYALTSNQPERLRAAAEDLGGTFYLDPREKWQHLPFRALATVVTDEFEKLDELADVGLYVVCRRTIKEGVALSIGMFPMVRHAELEHAQSDAHWRDKHAPLALEHHCHMTHYTQLSVTNTLKGKDFDGFALCGFDSEDDLRNRFFTTPESVKIIHDDVRSFANPKASPPRLIVSEERFG